MDVDLAANRVTVTGTALRDHKIRISIDDAGYDRDLSFAPGPGVALMGAADSGRRSKLPIVG